MYRVSVVLTGGEEKVPPVVMNIVERIEEEGPNSFYLEPLVGAS